MPTRSSTMRSLTRDSVAERRLAHRLRELDLGQELVGVDLLAVHRLGHPHVGVHELEDRKSTRLNSSHLVISYAVFCLKKKKKLIKIISSAVVRMYADAQ